MLRSGLGKRGDTTVEMGFFMIALIIAAVVAGSFIQKIVSDINGETFEKNYIARDIALTIDVVYAAPGDVEFTYSLKSFKLDVDIRESKVDVKKNVCKKNELPGVYNFFGDREDALKGIIVKKDSGPAPMLIVFSKKGGEVTMKADGNAALHEAISDVCGKA